jgi:hypothetical protein
VRLFRCIHCTMHVFFRSYEIFCVCLILTYFHLRYGPLLQYCNSHRLFDVVSIDDGSLLLTNAQRLQPSSLHNSPSTLNSTSTFMLVLQHLQCTRTQCASVHNRLQNCTLQQSILLPAGTELTTAVFASPGLT